MAPLFKPEDVELKWSKIWLEQDRFRGKIDPQKPAFSMVIPPPNVTGSLHMGHALNNTIQDILNRWKRMSGHETCWFPGTDHAGIATQVVVERELRKEGKSRFDLGREKFVEAVWKWKEQYGGIIDGQLKKLGVSCDWSRYSFTMDEKRSRAVMEAFVRLYQKGIIHRDRYIVNWCPKCQTALSDLEVEHPENEAPGTLYHIRYPLESSPDEGITVATVRPETLLGDVAVAVNPNDPRYKKLVGKHVILPLVGRRLSIIADEWADPSVGSGAVKITPAHDPNDFEVGKRHQLSPITVISPTGKIDLAEILIDETISSKNKEFLMKYQGLDRFECRKQIVADLKEKGYLIKEEPWPSNPGRCARSGDIIEPYLSVQWFARMKGLAEPAIRAVREGGVTFHPERYSKIYFDWMENIREWCISRQLWWGHRIPAWYCRRCNQNSLIESTHGIAIMADAKPIVGYEAPKSCPDCQGQGFVQDPDVLDTWFSSGLWPLSVMGWPDETEDLKYFYPTSVLSTGRDIIFLWVARMMMFGLEFKKEVPFRHVYIHPTILDREGRRMSKSKGTGVDPLDLITKYGADATRFGIILMAQGQDVRFNEEKIESARNFANKIWNAARFVLSNLSLELKKEKSDHAFIKRDQVLLKFYDHWILSRLSTTIEKVTKALDQYEFSNAAAFLYEFFWDDFCDWYLELSKLGLNDEKRKGIVQKILLFVLSNSLRLFHPFMPFLTEEIWQNLSDNALLLLEENWPLPIHEPLEKVNPKMETLMDVVRGIRNLKAELGLKPKDRVHLVIRANETSVFKAIESELSFLTQPSEIDVQEEKQSAAPVKALSFMTGNGTIYLSLEGLVDIQTEVDRLKAEVEKVTLDLQSVGKLLQDQSFIGKAKPEVVEKTKEKEKTLREKHDQIKKRIALFQA